jgi:hypothetical protein
MAYEARLRIVGAAHTSPGIMSIVFNSGWVVSLMQVIPQDRQLTEFILTIQRIEIAIEGELTNGSEHIGIPEELIKFTKEPTAPELKLEIRHIAQEIGTLDGVVEVSILEK